MKKSALISGTGLAVFVLTTLASLGVLGYDAHLALTGAETITERVTADPAWAVALVALVALGPAGLAVHFAFFDGWPWRWFWRRPVTQ
jgi:hypothetical protein